MRRGKNTTYGQRGGDGPNTGKKAVTFSFVRPDGESGKTRVFKDPPEGEDAFVVLYPPSNGHGWHTGRVAATQSAFDEFMASAVRDQERNPTLWGVLPVVVPCKRVGPGEPKKTRAPKPPKLAGYRVSRRPPPKPSSV